MTICFLNHDVRKNTGVGKFCLSFTQALITEKPNIKYKILTSDDVLSGGFITLVLNFFKIRRIFKEFDIIHALDGWPYGVIAVVASIGLNKKIVITAIGTGAVQPLHRFLKKPFMVWAYKRANKVVAISGNTKKEILKIVPDLNIEVINHGVDFNKFQFSRAKPQKVINLSPYILSVGALKKRKGHEFSIRAFAKIAGRFPEFKYVIVGRGPEEKNLKSQISNLKLEGRVVFLSNLLEEELIGIYHGAELFILLPQNDSEDIEGFGLVFLEAAACGLPVIATLNTSAEDAVEKGVNGFLVPTEGTEEAAAAILSVLDDEGLKEKLSKASIDFAKSMSWGKVAQKYCKIYEDYLSYKF